MSSYISTSQYPRFSTQNIPNEERINDFVLTYEIGEKFAIKLPHLVGFKIVFVFDDSGSMNTKLNESPLNSAHEKATRWDELKHFAEICVGAANIFDEEGADIYFLNRPVARKIHKIEELEPHMSKRPRGYTPLVNTMTKVFLDYEPMVLGGRKLLTIVVTDGEPTDDRGQVDINGFKKCLVSRPPYVYTNIVSCTDEDETMTYLNEWDRELQRLDVLDDYKSERDEIRAVQGKDFSFSLGDYIVKSLMGSIDSEIDDLDEIKL